MLTIHKIRLGSSTLRLIPNPICFPGPPKRTQLRSSRIRHISNGRTVPLCRHFRGQVDLRKAKTISANITKQGDLPLRKKWSARAAHGSVPYTAQPPCKLSTKAIAHRDKSKSLSQTECDGRSRRPACMCSSVHYKALTSLLLRAIFLSFLSTDTRDSAKPQNAS